MDTLREEKPMKVFYSALLFAFGIKKQFNERAHFFRFPLSKDIISPDGTVYKRMEVHIYNYDKSLAPEGSTVITVCFYTLQGDYWINMRNQQPEKYKSLKKSLAEEVLNHLDSHLVDVKPHVEMIDVATPATFYRYTNNWKGSTQGWLPGENLTAKSPVKHTINGLKNFYYAGQWCVPGGGIPVALKVGRDVTKLICRDTKKVFKTNQT
jgi:phytoene dehydrogenase-like protein